MKKYLKSTGIIPYLIVSLCLVLMVVAKAVSYEYDSDTTYSYYGQEVLYGAVHSPSPSAICAFIFLTMASTMLLIGAAVPLFKKDRTLLVFSGLLNLVSMVLIFAAAICVLCVKSDWPYLQNQHYVTHTGSGYIAVSILSFLASLLCLPSVIACLRKEKEEAEPLQ